MDFAPYGTFKDWAWSMQETLEMTEGHAHAPNIPAHIAEVQIRRRAHVK